MKHEYIFILSELGLFQKKIQNYHHFLPLEVNILGSQKLEKARGPVGRRIKQRFLESEQC